MATALPKKVWGKKSKVKGVLIRFDGWQKNKARFKHVLSLKKKIKSSICFCFFNLKQKESNLKQSDKLQSKQFLTVSIMHAFY